MLVLDRFEGEYALIEYRRKIFHVPKVFISKTAKPGDVLNIRITVDQEATSLRKKQIAQLADNMFFDNKI